MKLLPLATIFVAASSCSSIHDGGTTTTTESASVNTSNTTDINLLTKQTDSVKPSAIPDIKPPRGAIYDGLLNEKAKSLPQPSYPAAARAVNASGEVAVQILFNENGKVVKVSALTGHPLLRSAAEQAARKAEFSPWFLGGQPVKVSGVVTYNFASWDF